MTNSSLNAESSIPTMCFSNAEEFAVWRWTRQEFESRLERCRRPGCPPDSVVGLFTAGGWFAMCGCCSRATPILPAEECIELWNNGAARWV